VARSHGDLSQQEITDDHTNPIGYAFDVETTVVLWKRLMREAVPDVDPDTVNQVGQLVSEHRF